ncbi:MAG: carotenoid 1,2-hydratase [Nitrospirae bacterium]|nr:MAG: carotenoid 1,2-hydratase [Nitrospirota bacterium]
MSNCLSRIFRRPQAVPFLIAGLVGVAWICGVAPPAHIAAAEFRSALPGYQFRFPHDHGTHNEFQTEWWYYTGHLRAEDGKTFGFQLTFFRRAAGGEAVAGNPSRWSIRHLYFAHFAVTDEGGRRFHFAEKVSRAGIGKAGARTGRLGVWIDEWGVQADGDAHVLHAQAEGIALRLRLTPEKPPVIHGADGISRKGTAPGESSHYYSFTRMRTDGALTVDGASFPVTGLSWMDHEFGSNQLGREQVGWDWFSLQLADATELMVYQIRRRDGSVEPASGGTWIRADGTAVPLPRDAIVVDVLDRWQSPQSGGRYPGRWRIRVPSVRLAVEVAPTIAGQELITRRSTQVTYWEGSVTLTGEREGRAVSGLGYAELTGYAAPLRRRL